VKTSSLSFSLGVSSTVRFCPKAAHAYDAFE
jgi:hypothetical protein